MGWCSSPHSQSRRENTPPTPVEEGSEAGGTSHDESGSMRVITGLKEGVMLVTPPPRTGARLSVGTLAEGGSMHMGPQGAVGMHRLYIVLLS